MHSDTQRDGRWFKPILLIGASLLLVILFFAILSGGFFSNVHSSKENIVSSETHLIRDPECGPRSLWVAAGLLGVPLDRAQLRKDCHGTKEGASLLDLKNGAIASGLRAAGRWLTWDELTRMDTPVVLFVGNNHFLCVNPRETISRNGDLCLRMYDLPKATLYVGRHDLEQVWRGEALVVRRKPRAAKHSGPIADFSTTIVDFGVAEADNVRHAEFILTNVGTETLRILGMKASCGCSGLKASESEIPPGKTSTITMSFDLHGRQGAQLIQGYIRTDDPVRPGAFLNFRGYVEWPVLVTPGSFDFGEMISGQEDTKRVDVMDRGDQTLHIIDSDYAIELKDYAHDGISERLSPGTGSPRFIFASQRRNDTSADIVHYDGVLTCKVPRSAPEGKYVGTLRLQGQRSSGKTLEIPIPVYVHVVSDWVVAPSLLHFGVMRAGETRTCTIRIRRRSGSFVELLSCQVDAGEETLITDQNAGVGVPQCTVVTKGGDVAIVEIKLTAMLPQNARGTSAFCSGVISFHMNEEHTVNLNWETVVVSGTTNN